MQSTTGETISDIRNIVNIIEEVNSSIINITSAAEEQAAATGEITGNISQASMDLSEVNGNVAQTTVVVANIAGEIALVDRQSTQVGASSNQVEGSTATLARLAARLEKLVNGFKADSDLNQAANPLPGNSCEREDPYQAYDSHNLSQPDLVKSQAA